MLQLLLNLERLENHSRLDRSEAREGRIWRRKVKRRLVSSPLKSENVTSHSERQQQLKMPETTTSTTSLRTTAFTTSSTTITTAKPHQIESTSLSPEEWLEQFYNGKSLLRSKQTRKQMSKDKGKFDNFPRVPDNIVTQEKINDKINLFLKPLIVFSKDEIYEEETTSTLQNLQIQRTTVSPSPIPQSESVLSSGQPISRKKIKFGAKLSSIDVGKQQDLVTNAKSDTNKNIRNRLNILVDKLKGMVTLKIIQLNR